MFVACTLLLTGLAVPAGAQVPSQLAGIDVGGFPPGELGVEMYAPAAADRELGLEGELNVAVGLNGRVSHIILGDIVLRRDPDYRGLAGPEQIVQALTEAIGAPPSSTGDFWRTPTIWAEVDRTLEVWESEGCCGEWRTEVVLRTNEPARTCGPEDGFSEWLSGVQTALRARDPEAAARYFHFPFRDFRTNMPEVLARGEEPLLDMASPDEFVERFKQFEAASALGGLLRASLTGDGPAPECHPALGYTVWTMSWPLRIERTGGPTPGGWRATALHYSP